MPDLTQAERLQPSLLDRLTDDEPLNKQESRQHRVLSMKALREAVRRDLSWLLNTASLDTTEDLDDFDEVANSVLNYGIRDLSGASVIGLDIKEIEMLVHKAVLRFEPRILAETLNIRMHADKDEMSTRAVSFEIEGQLWAQPQPTRLFLRTALDLESGDVIVKDLGG